MVIAMTQPAWLAEARRHDGAKEVPGPKHSLLILGWLKALGAWWSDDETPWCGVFVAHCMRLAGQPLPKHWYRAKDWLNWGESLVQPCLGCVVVFGREGGGHVGFVVGSDAQGRVLCLGGNQGNAVNVRAFERSRVLGYRWPLRSEVARTPLPVLSADQSTTEA